MGANFSVLSRINLDIGLIDYREGVVDQNGIIGRKSAASRRDIVVKRSAIVSYGIITKHRVNFPGGSGSIRKRQKAPIIVVDSNALDRIGRAER